MSPIYWRKSDLHSFNYCVEKLVAKSLQFAKHYGRGRGGFTEMTMHVLFQSYIQPVWKMIQGIPQSR